jgi:hypothetical protein
MIVTRGNRALSKRSIRQPCVAEALLLSADYLKLEFPACEARDKLLTGLHESADLMWTLAEQCRRGDIPGQSLVLKNFTALVLCETILQEMPKSTERDNALCGIYDMSEIIAALEEEKMAVQ